MQTTFALIPPSIVDRPFEWQQFDCFTLASEIRSHHAPHLRPLPDIDWVYRKYPTAESMPDDCVWIVVRSYCVELKAIEPMALLCLNFKGTICLGTAIEVDGAIEVVYFGKDKVTSAPLERLGDRIHSVWRY